ncbi:glucosamine inositolphosphorylceramide transferase family protein [Egicoccus halophilus]|uniref:Glucosamine inositolphosphorylceramide transferase 1 N-terminal domain-containing protein n=1 Tax=Egicoccus halophilus TaxID=1670830 RepID=A0A8J3ACV3_9ACTN|nr:hypothetical protein [Egicoccus halophilus]GGI05434.1 hypothetical protein GCM10011354_14080 [Egicoccus halophilus]
MTDAVPPRPGTPRRLIGGHVRDALLRLPARLQPAKVRHRQEWAIGVTTGPHLHALQPNGAEALAITTAEIDDVPADIVADPFLICSGGRRLLFFEVLNRRSGRGEIGLAEHTGAGRWRYRGRVLVEPFHLSYPHVFHHEGCWYLVPETAEVEQVRLYRAVTFPDRWEYVTTLLEGGYFHDATPFRHQGRWWMFVETSSAFDTLRLYVADALTGPWREHPASPVVAGDASRARPAGPVVVDESGPIRFSQDCLGDYGRRVDAWRIVELTPDAYVEEPLGPVLTASGVGWNATGMHHVCPVRRPDGTWEAAVDGRGPGRPRIPTATMNVRPIRSGRSRGAGS